MVLIKRTRTWADSDSAEQDAHSESVQELHDEARELHKKRRKVRSYFSKSAPCLTHSMGRNGSFLPQGSSSSLLEYVVCAVHVLVREIHD